MIKKQTEFLIFYQKKFAYLFFFINLCNNDTKIYKYKLVVA